MATIKPRSVSDLRNFIKKIEALQRTISFIQKTALEKAADETILGEIHQEMETEGISKKIIETTYVGKTEIIDGDIARVEIISDYIADNGFDVGEAREEGTTDHEINPKKAKAISWIDQNAGGKRRFSLGHMVSGLVRLLIVERTLLRNKSKLADAYFNNITAAYSQALGV